MRAALLTAVLALGACATHEGIHDPHEEINRKNHEFNKSLDSSVLQPVANFYGPNVPDPIDDSIANFAQNLGTPQDIVNNTLQGDLGGAVRNTFRFAVNSTMGILGLMDLAELMGVPAEPSNFGETLHVWGVGEGAYMELPFLGPTTERDAVGKVVDLFTDPFSYVVPSPDRTYLSGASVAAGIDKRYKFGQSIDSVLYDSADSYSQLRLLTIQNRRFELGQDAPTTGAASEDELYDDLYFD